MPSSVALRFLSGPNLGGVVRLKLGSELVIGRQAGADLVLEDDLVSRRHVRLALDGDDVVVEDLGSTNGTYVNGVRVSRGRVAEGDRILVGGSILKVVAGESAGTSAFVSRAGAPSAQPSGGMQGRLEEVPVPDLLQLLANERRSGLLALQSDGRTAELRIEAGRLVACAIGGRGDLKPTKAFLRLLAWRGGSFELRAAPSAVGPSTAGASLEALLADGLQQLDALRRLMPRLPQRLKAGATLGLDIDVDDADRALLALATRRGNLQEVLDATPLPDAEAAQRLAALLTRGLLAAREG